MTWAAGSSAVDSFSMRLRTLLLLKSGGRTYIDGTDGAGDDDDEDDDVDVVVVAGSGFFNCKSLT